MPVLQDLFRSFHNTRRVVGRNLSDLVDDPASYLERTGDQAAITAQEYMNDPMNFVGGGVGQIAGRATGAGLASRVGTAHSMRLLNDQDAHRLYNNPKEVSPELLDLLDLELLDPRMRRGGTFGGQPAPRVSE